MTIGMEGKPAGGRPLRDEGGSLLEMEDGRVRRFRSHYDPGAFTVAASPLP